MPYLCVQYVFVQSVCVCHTCVHACVRVRECCPVCLGVCTCVHTFIHVCTCVGKASGLMRWLGNTSVTSEGHLEVSMSYPDPAVNCWPISFSIWMAKASNSRESIPSPTSHTLRKLQGARAALGHYSAPEHTVFEQGCSCAPSISLTPPCFAHRASRHSLVLL